MSQTSSTKNHSNLSDSELAQAIMGRDQLALAECFYRTNSVTNTIARRLFLDLDPVEKILGRVYSQLWTKTPLEENFHGWLRSVTWKESVAYLREHGEAPKFPSVSLMLPDLPAANPSVYDPAEKNINILPESWQRAFVQAQDMGIPTAKQEDPDATFLLINALLNLNEIKSKRVEELEDFSVTEYVSRDLIRRVPKLGDWAFKIGTYAELAEVDAVLKEEPEIAKIATALQGGAKRFIGLPVSQEIGARILISILMETAGSSADQPASAATTDGAESGSTEETQAASTDQEPLDAIDITAKGSIKSAQDLVDASGQDASVTPISEAAGKQGSSFGDDPFSDDFFGDDDEGSAATMVERMFSSDGADATGQQPVVGKQALQPMSEEDRLSGGLMAASSETAIDSALVEDDLGDPTMAWSPPTDSTSKMMLSDVLVAEGVEEKDPFSYDDDDINWKQTQAAPNEPAAGKAADPSQREDLYTTGNVRVISDDPADVTNIPFDPETSQKFASDPPQTFSEGSETDDNQEGSFVPYVDRSNLTFTEKLSVFADETLTRFKEFSQAYPSVTTYAGGFLAGVIIYLLYRLIF